MKLNQEQIEAIAAGEGAFNVQATAGSGKTETLTRRVQRLVNEGANLDDILAVTFTTEAAKNLERRLGLKLEKNRRGGFRTFHSFCLNLVRQESRFLSYGLSSEPFPAGNGLSKILLDAMKQHGIKRNRFEEVRAAISKWKRQRILPAQVFEHEEAEEEFVRAYSTYEARLREAGLLDFDSMICEAVSMLEKYPEVRERWQFKWILGDEFQDTDDLQIRLVQLISEKHGNVFIVSDPNQALYEFRGARPHNVVHFADWFPGAKTLILPENFRSTENIVAYSKKKAPLKNELIENVRTANPLGISIEYRMYPGAAEEAEAILSEAMQDPGHSAVLARTNNQIGVYETLALQHNIRFHLLGKSGLWNKPEVKNLVGLATFCMGNKIPEKYSENLVGPVRMKVRTSPADEAVKMIIKYANLENLYSNEDFSDDENFAITNLRTVADIAKRFRTLGDFLNHARRAAHASRKGKNVVTFGTIHSAKGLEFDNVFVIGVQEGKIPHEKSTNLEEEWRTFYVAITRPAKRLRISFAGTPSSFIKDDLTPEIRSELSKHAQTVERINKQRELSA